LADRHPGHPCAYLPRRKPSPPTCTDAALPSSRTGDTLSPPHRRRSLPPSAPRSADPFHLHQVPQYVTISAHFSRACAEIPISSRRTPLQIPSKKICCGQSTVCYFFRSFLHVICVSGGRATLSRRVTPDWRHHKGPRQSCTRWSPFQPHIRPQRINHPVRRNTAVEFFPFSRAASRTRFPCFMALRTSLSRLASRTTCSHPETILDEPEQLKGME